MKIVLRIFFYLFLVFIVLSILYKIADLFSDYEPFIYGLKTKQATKIPYLPEANSTNLPNSKTTIAFYSQRDDTSMAERIFKTAGTPYYKCANISDANASHILFLDFDNSKPTILAEKDKQFLYNFVANGGIVIANEIFNVRYGAMKELFGYKDFKATKSHKQFSLLNNPYNTYFDEKEERDYLLSTMQDKPYTNTIELGTAKPIATYEDKTPAITINNYKKGKAILLGISLYDLRYRNLVGKDFNANKHYCNEFEPLSDFIVLFTKALYEKELEKSITLSTAPNEYKSTIILSHDVDYIKSMKNIKDFIETEKELGVKSTFLIFTKYITDDKDRAYFNRELRPYVLNAQKNGFEIGSHTVVHTKNFSKLPLGTFDESYPEYHPFSINPTTDGGKPTVSGELKVSKELLLGAGIKEVVSFRSGGLLYNPKLPKAMEQLGYKNSSCFSAEDVLSYFPYRYPYDYNKVQKESKSWEFPLVLEDEEMPLYFRVDKALKLFKSIHNNGGVYTILVHPDLTLIKGKILDLMFIKSFFSKLPKDVWTDTMANVGDFWDKRDRVVFRYQIINNKLSIVLSSPVPIENLGFNINGFKIKPNPDIKILNGKLILNIKKGINRWQLDLL